jgi:hypothetical protein
VHQIIFEELLLVLSPPPIPGPDSISTLAQTWPAGTATGESLAASAVWYIRGASIFNLFIIFYLLLKQNAVRKNNQGTTSTGVKSQDMNKVREKVYVPKMMKETRPMLPRCLRNPTMPYKTTTTETCT